MPLLNHKTIICLLSVVVLTVTACDSDHHQAGAKPTKPVPIGSHHALQQLAGAFKALSDKFPRNPMDMPPQERKAFVEQVFINAGYSYDATLHELATHKADYGNNDVGDLVDLLTLPHRNTTSVEDYRHIYRPQELKDIKVIEERSTR